VMDRSRRSGACKDWPRKKRRLEEFDAVARGHDAKRRESRHAEGRVSRVAHTFTCLHVYERTF
jgi:hypothetical protein